MGRKKVKFAGYVLVVILVNLLMSRTTIQAESYNEDASCLSIDMTAPSGFEHWYRDDVEIKSTVLDSDENNLAILRYFVDGEMIKELDLSAEKISKYQFSIPVQKSSKNGKGVPIMVEVTDVAGNTNRDTKKIYIDRLDPQLSLEGCNDYQISGQPVVIEGFVKDENELISQTMEIQYTDVHKSTKKTKIPWEGSDGKLNATAVLQKNGIYEVTIQAMDVAGRVVETSMHFTVDQESPVIRYVEQLNGSQLQYFEWNYKPDDVVSDYTSYHYNLTVDGYLYQWKERVIKEGFHKFQIEAIDAAGNKSRVSAGFVIDHTAPKVLFGDVEENALYEESANLTIELENKKDRIQYIEINGQRQKIHPDSDFFQFPFQKVGWYEVKVAASDLAGNETIQTRQFEVIEKTTILKKMLKPIETILKI